MTSDKKKKLLLYEEVISVAKSILDGQIGVISGSRALTGLSHKFDETKRDDFILFIGIDSDSDNLAIGPEREYWSKEQLAKQDIEIEIVEAYYREDVYNTCTDLIRQIETEIIELTQDPS
ncbi:hypothetical protein IC229_34635 [Spirosoma sp. BT702]|uniref:Uncharacterized protein n=1 Tax=Spirosoma profusum TaxID=2771354 RepID=A0A927GAZ3_9BACT|nr:hypothetical protein [Spirosoma profusum]MBD2705788.1 hypothetical protein [Spirosoma profusum]